MGQFAVRYQRGNKKAAFTQRPSVGSNVFLMGKVQPLSVGGLTCPGVANCTFGNVPGVFKPRGTKKVYYKCSLRRMFNLLCGLNYKNVEKDVEFKKINLFIIYNILPSETSSSQKLNKVCCSVACTRTNTLRPLEIILL